MKRRSEVQAQYDARTARRYNLKLHLARDKDIIDRLDKEESMQGYIKGLIRRDLEEPLFIKTVGEKMRTGLTLEGVSKEDGCLSASLKDNENGSSYRIYEIPASDTIIVEKDGRVLEALHK